MKIDRQVKFEINDSNKLISNLKLKEAIFVGGNLEVTKLYDYDNNSLFKRGIFVRTKSGFRNVLTIKEKDDKKNSTFLERIKNEIEIEDDEVVEYIFEKIGLNNQYIMEKYRLIWKLNDTYINLDELPFGIYLEINGSDNQINNVIKILKLDKTKMLNKTYWDIFNQKKQKNEIKQTKNIKFESNYIFKIATLI